MFDCFLLSSFSAANDKVCRFFLISAQILAAFACGEAIMESQRDRFGLRCIFVNWKKSREGAGGSGNRRDHLLVFRALKL